MKLTTIQLAGLLVLTSCGNFFPSEIKTKKPNSNPLLSNLLSADRWCSMKEFKGSRFITRLKVTRDDIDVDEIIVKGTTAPTFYKKLDRYKWKKKGTSIAIYQLIVDHVQGAAAVEKLKSFKGQEHLHRSLTADFPTGAAFSPESALTIDRNNLLGRDTSFGEFYPCSSFHSMLEGDSPTGNGVNWMFEKAYAQGDFSSNIFTTLHPIKLPVTLEKITAADLADRKLCSWEVFGSRIADLGVLTFKDGITKYNEYSNRIRPTATRDEIEGYFRDEARETGTVTRQTNNDYIQAQTQYHWQNGDRPDVSITPVQFFKIVDAQGVAYFVRDLTVSSLVPARFESDIFISCDDRRPGDIDPQFMQYYDFILGLD